MHLCNYFLHFTAFILGIYVCTADNGVGKSQNQKTHLNVEFSPKIKVPSPRIPQALYHEATLTCEIKASPSPVMYWKKNNETIDNDGTFQISHFALADEMTVTKLTVSIFVLLPTCIWF